MNFIDILICIPLLWGLYKGFTKGLIIEALTLIAFGLALWGGIKFSKFLAQLIHNFLGWTSQYVSVISFGVLFLGILILVYALAKLIERLVKAVSLGFVNKLAGGIFGMLKFGLILSVLIFILNTIESAFGGQLIPAETKQKSLLYEPVGKIAPMIIPGLRESKLAGIIK